MIRIVVDTNVIVSALLSSAGFEDRVLKLTLRWKQTSIVNAREFLELAFPRKRK